jgi:two-component system phosphate regulon sensor histidine kinase PhoR
MANEKRRFPLGRLSSAALTWALPGLAVLIALVLLGALAPLWAALGTFACLAAAAALAAPVTRDVVRILAYGNALARDGEAPHPAIAGWAPLAQIAAAMRRIAREGRRREQALRGGMVASERVFDALPQPLLLLDDSRRVMRVNRHARGLIGVDPSGNDLATAFRDPRVLEAADEVLATKTHREVSLAVQDPVDRFFSVQIVPFREPAADGATVLVALYDLTERRRAEQMRADFIANASHELRTPLATLTGFIETLSGPARDDPEARERFLKLMHEQASRMARLVQDLLSLSAIEMSEHARPELAVDLPRVLRGVIASLQLEARNKAMTIVPDIPEGLPAVPGDADQLAQLFQNLIDNAIKYGRKGTEIRVSVRAEREVPPGLGAGGGGGRPPGVVWIAVSDHGEGIAAEHIPRLTERFYRVDTARSRAVGGTGLGLAIVKHIVSRHRGLLRVESEEGVGSTFAVCLPEPPAGEAPDSEAPAA